MNPAHQFCTACGHAVEWKVPAGDHAPRHVCPACGHIHYLNPKVIVGVIPEAEDGRILLCRRNIEPRLGFWTYPAGFMEMGETSAFGAAREALEESEADIEVLDLCTLINVPHVNQLHLAYRGRLRGEHFAPTPESSEVRLFSEAEIPWGEIAFPTIYLSLKRHLEDRAAGTKRFHEINLAKPERREGMHSMDAWLAGGVAGMQPPSPSTAKVS